MSKDLNVKIELDATDVFKELGEAKQEADKVEEYSNNVIERVQKNTAKSYREVVRMARIAWSTTQAVITAAGGAISMEFQSLISMGLSSLSLLVPIAKGEALMGDPMAMMALAQFATAAISLATAQQQSQQVKQGISGALSILNGISAIVAGPYFLNRRY